MPDGDHGESWRGGGLICSGSHRGEQEEGGCNLAQRQALLWHPVGLQVGWGVSGGRVGSGGRGGAEGGGGGTRRVSGQTEGEGQIDVQLLPVTQSESLHCLD